MKKSHHFSELSDKRCDFITGHKEGRPVRCDKPLKLRLVESKAAHNVTKCYEHHLAIRPGHNRSVEVKSRPAEVKTKDPEIRTRSAKGASIFL